MAWIDAVPIKTPLWETVLNFCYGLSGFGLFLPSVARHPASLTWVKVTCLKWPGSGDGGTTWLAQGQSSNIQIIWKQFNILGYWQETERREALQFVEILPICMFQRKMHTLYRNMLARTLSLN